MTGKVVSLEEDEDNLVFAFTEDESGAGRYVMFQYALNVDDGGGLPDHDGLYIECDDQSEGCYRAVTSIKRIGNHVKIRLNKKGRERLQVESILIESMPWNPTISRGLARLAELSGGEYEVGY